LAKLGPKAVLVKGGHVAGDIVRDVLCADGKLEVFDSPRIETSSTHGTGCTLASAIAAGLAQGLSMRDAVIRARAYVREAIRTAPGFGKGHGPLNHAHTVKP
jgi:hydroxymethylpyrimidine/phosphomethylpyrimidine kinase